MLAAEDPACRDEVTWNLERSVSALDAMLNAHDSQRAHQLAAEQGQGKKRSWDTDVLVHCLLAFRHCRSRHARDTQNLFQHMVSSLVPKPLQAFVREASLQPPGSVVLSRSLVSIDATLSLVHGEHIEAYDGPIYLYADASVQAKVDWFNSMYDYISQSEVKPCFEAVHELVRLASTFLEMCSAEAEDDVQGKLQLAHMRSHTHTV